MPGENESGSDQDITGTDGDDEQDEPTTQDNGHSGGTDEDNEQNGETAPLVDQAEHSPTVIIGNSVKPQTELKSVLVDSIHPSLRDSQLPESVVPSTVDSVAQADNHEQATVMMNGSAINSN